jgi:hypothetical protein
LGGTGTGEQVFGKFDELVHEHKGAPLNDYTLRLIGSDCEHFIRKLLQASAPCPAHACSMCLLRRAVGKLFVAPAWALPVPVSAIWACKDPKSPHKKTPAPAPVLVKTGSSTASHQPCSTVVRRGRTRCFPVPLLPFTPAVVVTRFVASLPTDNCPQPKGAQPLSQLDIRLI